jgi:hypothetical protein
MVWTRGAQILYKSRIHLKIIGTDVQNLVTRATRSPGFVIPWSKLCIRWESACLSSNQTCKGKFGYSEQRVSPVSM